MQVRFPNAKELIREVDRFPLSKSGQPPIIGISCNRKDELSCIAEPYVQSVLKAGGSPILIPVITDIESLIQQVSLLDGLILTGGGDINPLYLNQEPIPQLQDVDPFRDEYDLILLRLASNRQIPVFGICRGHQVINTLFGGSLYQDIYVQSDHELIKHSQSLPRQFASHSIRLTDGNSKLSSIFGGKDTVMVNSIHHQGVQEVAPEFIATAVAPDGINEAMEHSEKYLLSVQWHPETMTANGNEEMLKLFKHHVSIAALYREAKYLHKRIITLDSHTDTPMFFTEGFNLGVRHENTKVSLPQLEEGKIDAVVMVAYLPQEPRDPESLEKATAFAVEKLQAIKEQEVLNPERMAIAYTPEDIRAIKKDGKKAIILGIENGYAIGKDLANITRFKEMGVSYITLCHNGDNDICDSAKGLAEWNGLSPFGKEVIREMNDKGIMIDVSHTSEKTFYDVLEKSRLPVIASHSSARALCDHPRNLTDEQIKALAANGGVVQVCLYKGFINTDEKKASLTDAIKHINHIVGLVGTDYVGIGSDFDGDGEVIGCRSTNELINITMRLLKEGYSPEDIEKIWGGNFLRVMKMSMPTN